MSERDELAKLMYVADNSRQSEEESLKDWDVWIASSGRDVYTHRMADAVLAAGYTKG
jgi:hypothetical protein